MIAIIGILAAILIPIVGRARDAAKTAHCQSNLRQWHTAWVLHANDNDGWVTPSREYVDGEDRGWVSILGKYMGYNFGPGGQQWMFNGIMDHPGHCMADQHEHGYSFGGFRPENYTSYGYNNKLGESHSPGKPLTRRTNLEGIEPRTIVFGDKDFWQLSGSTGLSSGPVDVMPRLLYRHNGRANAIQAGGAVYVANRNSAERDPPIRMFDPEGGM